MLRYFILSLLLQALLSPSAFASDNSPVKSAVVHGGGLMCFTITPAEYEKGKTFPSCDALCAAQNAACTDVNGNFNPRGCELPNAVSPGQQCRCCALDHH